jgi:hypothetical protein
MPSFIGKRLGSSGAKTATGSAVAGISGGTAGAAAAGAAKAKGLLLLGKGVAATVGVAAISPLGIGVAIGALATLLYGANAVRSKNVFRHAA